MLQSIYKNSLFRLFLYISQSLFQSFLFFISKDYICLSPIHFLHIYIAAFPAVDTVQYNAFQGMGGNLSFVFAMLDYTNTGFVLKCIVLHHSKFLKGCAKITV